MTPTKLLLLTAAAALTAGVAGAQDVTRMTLRPESKVTLDGNSNVHKWSCSTAAFQADVEMASTYLVLPVNEVPKPITKVSVTIPVTTLKCGNGRMDNNMYKALKADQFPDIRYSLATYELDTTATTADTFLALTTGELTVSGKTIPVQIPITAVRSTSGSITGEGRVKLLMTDFGIKPPVALLGTLRTKNEIEIAFKVLLDKAAVVALMQQ
jgi:polyisoprenoid-binding protein YceI